MEVSNALWTKILEACGAIGLLEGNPFEFNLFYKAITTQEISKELTHAIEVIIELGSEDGVAIIQNAATANTFDLSPWSALAARELIAELWLASRNNKVIQEVIECARVNSHEAGQTRAHKEYIGKDNGQKFIRPSFAPVQAAIVASLNKIKLNEAIQIFECESDDGSWRYDVLRGDAAKRVVANKDGRAGLLDYHSVAADHIRFDPLTTRLSIATRSPKLLPVYTALWGELLANDSDFFNETNACTLLPLMQHGRDLLKQPTVNPIVRVDLVGLKWHRHDGDKIIVRSRDCFNLIEEIGRVKQEGDFVEAKLSFTFQGQRRKGKVSIKVPHDLEIQAGMYETEVERYLTEIGIRGPFDKDGRQETLWTLYPWQLQETQWRRILGSKFDQVLNNGYLKAFTLPTVPHPAFPTVTGALAVDMATETAVYGYSDDEEIGIRRLTSSDVEGYRLDEQLMMKSVAAELLLTGTAAQISPGIWYIGDREFPNGITIPIFVASRQPTAETDHLITATAVTGTPVVILPSGCRYSLQAATVTSNLPQGPFDHLMQAIIQRLRLQNRIPAVLWANEDLVIDETAKKVWFKKTEIELDPDEQPYKFISLIAGREGDAVKHEEIRDCLSPARGDASQCSRAAKKALLKAIEASYTAKGQTCPPEVEGIIISRGGGYCCPVPVRVVRSA